MSKIDVNAMYVVYIYIHIYMYKHIFTVFTYPQKEKMIAVTQRMTSWWAFSLIKHESLTEFLFEFHSFGSNLLWFSILFGLDNGSEQKRYQVTIQITNGPVLLFSWASLGQKQLTASAVTILAGLIHLERMTHISVSKLGHHWFRLWLVVFSVLNYYLNQCWLIVNWTLRNKLQCLNQNKVIFIQQNAFQSVGKYFVQASMC